MQALSQSQFQAAFNHGAVQSVEIEPSGSRFAVKFLTLTGAAMLVQARKTEPRLFGTVDSALKLLHKLGVRRIVLERLDQWHPEQPDVLRRSRPDRDGPGAARPRARRHGSRCGAGQRERRAARAARGF